MSSEVKRYSHFHGGHNERADFVLATDYAALEAENARLREEISQRVDTSVQLVGVRLELDAAIAQLAAIQQAKGEEVETAAWAVTWARVGDTPARTEVLPANVFESPAAPRFYSYREPLGSIPAFQRIRAAMAAELERLNDRNESLEQQAEHNYEVARAAADQLSALRAELAEVKGREAVPVLVAYECCHCGAPTEAPKPFSAFVVCPACGEKTAATRAARYAPASPDVEGLVKALEELCAAMRRYFPDENPAAHNAMLERADAALSTWRQGQGKA